MRVRFMFLIVVFLLGGCGQPDVARQGATAPAYPAPAQPTQRPYPLAGLEPYPMATAIMETAQIEKVTTQALAVSLSSCPAPGATDTPLPTWTPVPPGFPTMTPVPMPSPAPFPGDFVLVLSACSVQDAAPQTVRFIASLTGGPDNSYELYCTSMTWDFGDGQMMMSAPSCVPWSPDMRIQRTITTDYTYKQPGVYQARLKIGGRGGMLKSNVVTIEVQ